MKYIDNLLHEIIQEARDINIPISSQIANEIMIDYGQIDRMGACYQYKYPTTRYVIHLSSDTLNGSEYMIKSIIAHEILHTCKLCTEHNSIWNFYKNKMIKFYNYNIKVEYSWGEIFNMGVI